MNLEEFKKEKTAGREILFSKILETFKGLNPIAIHQFGSGINNYRDEFSDLDLWITFPDEIIKEMVDKREEVYASVAPILVKSDAPANAPIGGSYTMVLYDTPSGLFHVDYYFSPKSGNNIRTDAKVLYGDDSLPRGEWILQREDSPWSEEHVFDQALAMTFILNKAVIRGGWNETHADYIRSVYKDLAEISKKPLPPLPISADFVFINALFDNLAPFANERQKKAIEKLKAYTNQLEKLYKPNGVQ